MRANNLLAIGAVAVAGFMFGPQIRDALPFINNLRGFTMHLDPGEVSPNVEDRRGQRGGLPDDAGGPDIGRMGPGPHGGPGGGAPWDQAGGDDVEPGGFPGGGRRRGGGGLRCRDTQTGRDVAMEFCDRQDGRRRP
jgi:hypothetical protein